MAEWERGLGVRLLGSVVLDGPAGPVTTRSPLLRTLLARLALVPATAVSGASLIDELWGEALPQSPPAALQVLATRLRKWLAHAGVANAALLSSTGGGYVLAIEPAAVDLVRFHDAAGRALAEHADHRTVLDAGARALREWSGEPFDGAAVASRLGAERVRAQDRLLRVVERRASVLLDIGHAEDAVEALTPHLAEHRDRERLVSLAATALHRAGRTTDALAVVAQTRRILRHEHGLDLPAGLVACERAILGARPQAKGPARATGIVGRGADLAMIRTRLDATDAGCVVLLTGEAGIGKSSLIRAASQEATARGVRVGSGAWDEDIAPLSGWFDALRELGVPPAGIGGPAVGRPLRGRLADAAREGPVLLALDDVHRADSASLGALRTLARLGLPAGLVVLVGAREPNVLPRSGWSDLRADLARLDSVVEIELAELDEASSRTLAVARLPRLGAVEADRVADALWPLTGGHPLHLASLLDVVDGLPDVEACLAAAASVPPRLRPLFSHRLGRLPSPCRDALEALAVLRPIRARDLGSVLGEEAHRLCSRLRPAVELGLVAAGGDRFAFRHELGALAVLESVPSPARAELHHLRWQRLDPDADPFEVLRHVLGASSLLEPGVVGRARAAAGRAAYHRGAYAEALDLLDRASRDDAELATATRAHRGLALEALGRRDEADDALDEVVADIGSDVEDAVLAAVGDDALGIAVAGRSRRLTRLHRVRERSLADHQRVRVLRALIVEEEQLFGDVATHDALPELLALCARHDGVIGIDDARLLGQVRALEANRLADAPVSAAQRLAVCERAHLLAVRAGDDVLRLEVEELLVAASIAAGDVERALAVRAALESEARRRHRPRSIWAVLLVDAALRLARGETDAAEVAAQCAMVRGQELGLPDAPGAFGVHLLARHWLGGTLPTLGGLPARAAQQYPHVAAWSAAAAVDALQGGDLEGAVGHLADFHRTRAGREGRMFDRPGLCLAAAAAFGLGDTTTARTVLRGLPPDPGAVVVVGIGAAVFGPVALFQGLATAVLGDHEGARALFGIGADLAKRLGWTPWSDAAARLTLALDRTPGDPDRPTALPLGLTIARSPH